jgi:LacI family transcriptional regulator
MALKRVTIQDIADACGLSRNTVSKVFNGRGAVPEATKKAVLQKAQELGYYQLPEEAAEHIAPAGSRNIALLTSSKPMNHNFGSFFITGFTDQICRAGYNLKMYEISPEELQNRTLPPHLLLKDTAGILGIELFDKAYLDMLCSVGLPTIFMDSFADAGRALLRGDLISMENYSSTITLTQRLIAAGAKEIGFVGDIRHCMSFEERWLGFCAAMRDANLVPAEACSILAKDSILYGNPDWLLMHLNKMPHIPDAFVCANDYLAIHLMTALKRKGLSIPADVMVTGFDGSPESAIVEPALSTAQIPSADIGRITADILLNRIQNPERPYMRTYVKTVPIFRESTR